MHRLAHPSTVCGVLHLNYTYSTLKIALTMLYFTSMIYSHIITLHTPYITSLTCLHTSTSYDYVMLHIPRKSEYATHQRKKYLIIE